MLITHEKSSKEKLVLLPLLMPAQFIPELCHYKNKFKHLNCKTRKISPCAQVLINNTFMNADQIRRTSSKFILHVKMYKMKLSFFTRPTAEKAKIT